GETGSRQTALQRGGARRAVTAATAATAAAGRGGGAREHSTRHELRDSIVPSGAERWSPDSAAVAADPDSGAHLEGSRQRTELCAAEGVREGERATGTVPPVCS